MSKITQYLDIILEGKDLSFDQAKAALAGVALRDVVETMRMGLSGADVTPLHHELEALQQAMGDPDSAVRYWGVLGMLMRGKLGVASAHSELRVALKDSSTDVRIAAAQALGQFGTAADLKEVLPLLADHADWKKHNVFSAMAALNSLDALGAKAAPLAATIGSLPTSGLAPNGRYSSYVPRLLEDLGDKFK